jgi:hypothetical protein
VIKVLFFNGLIYWHDVWLVKVRERRRRADGVVPK